MHFSRSPFMALAVTAMIGRSLNARDLADRAHRVDAVHLRHHDVHQHDVDVRRRPASVSIASRPFSADTICMSCSSSTLVSAKMLRMSSSTISTLLPGERLVDRAESLRIAGAAARQSRRARGAGRARPGRAAAPRAARRARQARAARSLAPRRPRSAASAIAVDEARQRGGAAASRAPLARSSAGMSGSARIEHQAVDRLAAASARERRRRRADARVTSDVGAAEELDERARRAASGSTTSRSRWPPSGVVA